MLDRVRKYFVDNPDKDSFFKIIGMNFPPGSAEYRLIGDAYSVAKEAFRGVYREGNGERYFEHIRRVALIVLLDLRVTDAEVIAATILHDIVEDIEGWTHERVSMRFTQRTGELVWWVSKLPVSYFGGDKESRDRAFHHRLFDAPRDAIIIKMPDRLDNNLAMWGVDEAKQRRKIRETQDFFLSLAEKHIILIHETEAVLMEIQKTW